MQHQPIGIFGAIEDKSTAQSQKQRMHAVDELADDLWAEHGWSLTLQDVAGLLVGLLVIAVSLA